MRDLFVDGYNVLHALPRYRGLLANDAASARGRLVDDLASFSVGSWRTTVVFDCGAEVRTADGVQGVEVVYAPAGVEADTVIESLTRSARDRGDDAVVVTGDAAMAWTVLGRGVTRMSPLSLESALSEDAREREESIGALRSSTVIDHSLDERTRSELLRIRDGRD
jgi:predicted RNA-binding protein with PIN domain